MFYTTASSYPSLLPLPGCAINSANSSSCPPTRFSSNLNPLPDNCSHLNSNFSTPISISDSLTNIYFSNTSISSSLTNIPFPLTSISSSLTNISSPPTSISFRQSSNFFSLTSISDSLTNISFPLPSISSSLTNISFRVPIISFRVPNISFRATNISFCVTHIFSSLLQINFITNYISVISDAIFNNTSTVRLQFSRRTPLHVKCKQHNINQLI